MNKTNATINLNRWLRKNWRGKIDSSFPISGLGSITRKSRSLPSNLLKVSSHRLGELLGLTNLLADEQLKMIAEKEKFSLLSSLNLKEKRHSSVSLSFQWRTFSMSLSNWSSSLIDGRRSDQERRDFFMLWDEKDHWTMWSGWKKCFSIDLTTCSQAMWKFHLQRFRSFIEICMWYRSDQLIFWIKEKNVVQCEDERDIHFHFHSNSHFSSLFHLHFDHQCIFLSVVVSGRRKTTNPLRPPSWIKDTFWFGDFPSVF